MRIFNKKKKLKEKNIFNIHKNAFFCGSSKQIRNERMCSLLTLLLFQTFYLSHSVDMYMYING